MKNIIIAVPILFAIVLMIASCNSSTAPKYGSLSGSIRLENDSGNPENDPIDYSGIKISLYKPALLDSSIINPRTKHPSIAFAICQNSEFDHREHTPIVSLVSTASGSFKFGKIAYGTYNLVIEKEGWGYRYIYDVMINQKELSLTSSELTLYPEHHISGTFSGSIHIQDWHHLVVDSDVSFLPGSNLSLGDNGFVRINPGAQLNIYGSFKAKANVGKMFQITNNAISSDETKSGLFTSFSLKAGSTLVENTISCGRFSKGSRSLGLEGVLETQVINCRFNSPADGIYASQSQNLFVKNCIFTSPTSENAIGLNVYNLEGCAVQQSLFSNLKNGQEIIASAGVTIENNYYKCKTYAIASYDSQTSIIHNSIVCSSIAILLAGTSTPLVEYCQIEAPTGIKVGSGDYYYQCNPTIRRNNLFCSYRYLTISRPNPLDVDARNNYFYSVDRDYIRSKIYHKPDYASDQQHMIGNFIYEPFLQSKVSNAGISS